MKHYLMLKTENGEITDLIDQFPTLQEAKDQANRSNAQLRPYYPNNRWIVGTFVESDFDEE